VTSRCPAHAFEWSSTRRRTSAALALALAVLLGTACSGPARSFGRTPADARTNADGLFSALALRFGPHERDEGLRAVRPKLLKHFLTPAAIHRDELMWSSIEDSARTLAVAGELVEGRYILAKRPEVGHPAYPGASRHIMELSHISDEVYEWDATDEVAVGDVGAQELFAVFTRTLAALEQRRPAAIRAALPLMLGRSVDALGRLYSIDSLASTPFADGSAALVLVLRMEPDRIRDESPKLAEYLKNYFSSARHEITIEDDRSAAWVDLRIDGERLELRWRSRDGRLQPIEGPGRPAPDTFRIRISASVKALFFRVGVSDLVGDLHVIDTPQARGWEVRFREEPDWQLPLASEHLLGGPLSRPFEGEGALLRYVARDYAQAQTVLARDIRIQVQESTALRLLNHISNKAASDYDGQAEAELLRFTAEAIEALHRDVTAWLPAGRALGEEPDGRSR
jgi:hypothetical protein